MCSRSLATVLSVPRAFAVYLTVRGIDANENGFRRLTGTVFICPPLRRTRGGGAGDG